MANIIVPPNQDETLGNNGSGAYSRATLKPHSDLSVTNGANITADNLKMLPGSTLAVDDGATVTVDGAAPGKASSHAAVDIGNNGTFVEDSGAGIYAPINFSGSGGTLSDESAASNGIFSLNSEINGFAPGDTIDIATTATSAVFVPNTSEMPAAADNGSTGPGGMLNVYDGNTLVGQFQLNGDYTGDTFHVSPDGSGGTDITVSVPCFTRGMRVRTDRGEVPVEDVAIGDRLMTLSGEAKPVKWIGRRSYTARVAANKTAVMPIFVRAGALADGIPARDLFMSPEHGLHLDGMLVRAVDLINGVSVKRCAITDRVEYFNFDMGAHEVILVEGAPTESFVDQHGRFGRRGYENWSEFATLYPHEAERTYTPAAPRRDSGPEVETVRRRINARAGLHPAADPGELLGRVERLDWGTVKGWAFNASDPLTPVTLEVLVDDVVVGEVVANFHRLEHEREGHGLGRVGFQTRLPAGISRQERHAICLRRASDKAPLDSSLVLEAAIAFDADGTQRMARPLAAAAEGDVVEIDQAVVFLLVKAERLLEARTALAEDRARRTSPHRNLGVTPLTQQRAAA